MLVLALAFDVISAVNQRVCCIRRLKAYERGLAKGQLEFLVGRWALPDLYVLQTEKQNSLAHVFRVILRNNTDFICCHCKQLA